MSETTKFVLIVLGFIILSLFIMKYVVWGFLIFFAALSLLHGLAEWTNTWNLGKQKGTRVFIWFLNHKLLLEILDFTLGYITGGTGTITGIAFGITTGLVASLFRVFNHQWKQWKQETFVEFIYKNKLPKTWKTEESLLSIMLDHKP